MSTAYGDPSVWPGDTSGIASLAPNQVVLTWGSAIPIETQPKAQILAAVLTFAFRRERSPSA